ncbi:hypothetical protein TNCV_4608791 [Trichonephila clavipes]|nr:hypothetical protein TNCV_4608791 [Trichonephila clavipes]
MPRQFDALESTVSGVLRGAGIKANSKDKERILLKGHEVSLKDCKTDSKKQGTAQARPRDYDRYILRVGLIQTTHSVRSVPSLTVRMVEIAHFLNSHRFRELSTYESTITQCSPSECTSCLGNRAQRLECRGLERVAWSDESRFPDYLTSTWG